jgi:serine/threonine-protein kinase
MPGWCNGTAGYVFLWTEAHKATGEDKYLDLAEGAAWHVWETPSPIATLCCGMAGQAYALLNFYRHTGDAVWLRRARDAGRLAAVAAMNPGSRATGEYHPEGLYKGDFGVGVLDYDLENPAEARMPVFERET